jgi:truncated hemoglobin YjbI
MKNLSLTALTLVGAFGLAACGDSGGDPTGDPSTDPQVTDPSTTDNPPTTSGDPTETGGADAELCTHLGGYDGVGQLVGLFLTAVIVDDRVNAYFLKSDLDAGALGKCVQDQLGEAAGCAGVKYTCKDMKTSHAGLGISTQDFTDFAEDFSTAWDQHKAMNAPDLTDEEKTAVIGILSGMAGDIVEDADNNVTVYQRVGRKPAIKGLIGKPEAAGSFVANVAADASIVGFFAASDFDRLNTCLTRQVHSIDGPNTYGKEVDSPAAGVDPGVSAATPCLDMVTSHADLVDDMGIGIEFADFGALVTALVTAMTDAGVPMDDQNAILGALGPLCSSIVTVDPDMCP